MTSSELSRIFKLEFTEKEAAYKQLIQHLSAKLDKSGLEEVAKHLIIKEGAEQNGRTYVTPRVLGALIAEVGKEVPEDADESKYFDEDTQLALAKSIVHIIKQKADDFPTQLMKATRLLSECYQAAGEFELAARTLSGFKFDGYRQPVEANAADRMRWFVDTSMFFLEVDDSANASTAIKRAYVLLGDIEKNSELYITFKTCYARVQDCQRQFLAAARDYHMLSQFYGMVEESALMDSLKYAVTCAILAPAGPERTRRLAILYADDRVSQLPNFQMLEKVFKERIIRRSDVEKFEKLLLPHQNAITSSGNTVLARAIESHNMLATSKIYKFITFDELGTILNMSPRKAEDLARRMIEAGQMEGLIDQVEGVVEFKNQSGSLQEWDRQINHLCLQVNSVLEKIAKHHKGYTV